MIDYLLCECDPSQHTCCCNPYNNRPMAQSFNDSNHVHYQPHTAPESSNLHATWQTKASHAMQPTPDSKCTAVYHATCICMNDRHAAQQPTAKTHCLQHTPGPRWYVPTTGNRKQPDPRSMSVPAQSSTRAH